MRRISLIVLLFVVACATTKTPYQNEATSTLPNKKGAYKNKKHENPWIPFKKALRNSNWQEAIEASDVLLKQPTMTAQHFSDLLNGRVRAHHALGQKFAELQDLQIIISTPGLSSQFEQANLRVSELIEGYLTVEELETVAKSSTSRSFRAQAWFRLGQLSLEAKEISNAKKYFSNSIDEKSDSDAGRRSLDLLSQLDAANKVETRTIGAVLPLTGRFAGVSQKTLRGIQMGLGLGANTNSPFRLAVVDSEGNPDGARKGVERLVKEDNVIAIIGSILSRTASSVATKAAELGVPSITLSQKAGITEAGPSVFRNALTSEMQVRQLVKTAMEDYGLKRFAVLFPNDPYGIEFTNIFWDEVLARGGSVTSAQTYSSKETDFRFAIERLVGTYYVEDRDDEYKYRLKEWSSQRTKITDRTTLPEDMLEPIVDFDALFIPDSAKSMGQIAAMLAYNNVHNVRLLGTNLWNVPGLEKRAGVYAKDLLFVDSFVPTDPNFKNSPFVKDYKSLYGEEPGIFEIQGYDSALILRQLIATGNQSRDELTSALSKLHNFQGALGHLSIATDREILRPVVALTLEGADIVPIKPPIEKH